MTRKNFSPLENLETVMSNSNNTPQVNLAIDRVPNDDSLITKNCAANETKIVMCNEHMINNSTLFKSGFCVRQKLDERDMFLVQTPCSTSRAHVKNKNRLNTML